MHETTVLIVGVQHTILKAGLESTGSLSASSRHPGPCKVGPPQGAGRAWFGRGLSLPETRVAELRALRSNSPNRRGIVCSQSLRPHLELLHRLSAGLPVRSVFAPTPVRLKPPGMP